MALIAGIVVAVLAWLAIGDFGVGLLGGLFVWMFAVALGAAAKGAADVVEEHGLLGVILVALGISWFFGDGDDGD